MVLRSGFLTNGTKAEFPTAVLCMKRESNNTGKTLEAAQVRETDIYRSQQ